MNAIKIEMTEDTAPKKTTEGENTEEARATVETVETTESRETVETVETTESRETTETTDTRTTATSSTKLTVKTKVEKTQSDNSSIVERIPYHRTGSFPGEPVFLDSDEDEGVARPPLMKRESVDFSVYEFPEKSLEPTEVLAFKRKRFLRRNATFEEVPGKVHYCLANYVREKLMETF